MLLHLNELLKRRIVSLLIMEMVGPSGLAALNRALLFKDVFFHRQEISRHVNDTHSLIGSYPANVRKECYTVSYFIPKLPTFTKYSKACICYFIWSENVDCF